MLDAIYAPMLLIDEEIVRRNLARMMARAVQHDLAFRPHGKTHQHPEVSRWLQGYGIDEVTVTSLRMAREFLEWGWQRVVIAMPVNVRAIAELEALAKQLPKTTNLTVFVADQNAAQLLADRLSVPLSYYIEVDLGYGRSGMNWHNADGRTAIRTTLAKHNFRGHYAHSGHTYDAVGQEAIGAIHQIALKRIAEVNAKDNTPRGFALGDTPACSTQEDFTGVHAIGPGNFIYYDLVQAGIGSCELSNIAVCLATPVVQVKSGGQELVVHTGWVQLGKDQLSDGTYGRVVQLDESGHWDASRIIGKVTKLSQEHGTIKLDQPGDISNGDLVGILPVHACAVVHGMRATGDQLILPRY